ncbi:hypothetical protein B0H17DRAFT_1218855 [Mycena rosella]|uniref:Uncharacterized protein n=1 Tax=Mycena rosella TaxID=1033263 RepID=A0AAD7FKI0_MYCRO|nr:hypothetical protein B0H17DRAFT_1218855 [Mycena rosella]
MLICPAMFLEASCISGRRRGLGEAIKIYFYAVRARTPRPRTFLRTGAPESRTTRRARRVARALLPQHLVDLIISKPSFWVPGNLRSAAGLAMVVFYPFSK